MSNLTIDINGYCNEACKFCYQNLDGSTLSEDEILKLVDENPKARTVEIGGGEPFLDPRIVDLIRFIREKGRGVHIATNATRIPEGFLDLEDSVRGEVQIQVSIHGSNPEMYQRVHGKNLFDKVIGNTKRIKSKFDTIMTSAVYQENFNDVTNLVRLAEELDIPLRVNLVFPVGKGASVQRLKGRKIDSPLIHQNNCYAISEAYGIERKGICPFDCGKVYVSPSGEKSSCEFYNPSKSEQLNAGDSK